MQPKRLIRGIVFPCLLGLLAGAGCRRTPSTAPARSYPYEGVVVRVACPDAVAEEVVRSQGRAWALREGARVEVVRFDPARGPETVADADAWVIAPPKLPHGAGAGRLAALPPEYTARDGAYHWMRLLPLYREHLLLWNGAKYGLPLLGESPLCCYRSDWLADPVHRRAFRQKYGRDLAAPETWEQYADLAAYFHAHGQAGRPGPSLPPLPADGAALARLFYTVAAGFARRAVPAEEAPREGDLDAVFSFHFDLRSGRPRIDTPGFVAALELLRRLQAYRPTGATARPEEAFRSGQAVLCLTSAAWLPVFQKEPALRDRFGICKVPGAGRYFAYDSGREQPAPAGGNRVPYLGATGRLGVVPHNAPHAEAAFSLLAHLSGPEAGAQVALEPRWGGGPVRDEQLHRERWDAFDLDAERTAALKQVLQQTLLHRGVKNPVLALRVPAADEYEAALLAHLRPALEQPAGLPAAALAAVARRWEAIIQARGPDRHRADYRISLGLRSQ